MYNNTGEKIKGFAVFFAFIEILVLLVIGIISFILFSRSLELVTSDLPSWAVDGVVFVFLAGCILSLLGIFLSWSKYLLLAAFGELVDKTGKSSLHLERIDRNLQSFLDNKNK